MPERFTETLRAASEPGWSDAVGHRFVKELFAGAVPDAVMARYLIQDHRFAYGFLAAAASIASTIADAHASATSRRYFSATLETHPALTTMSLRE